MRLVLRRRAAGESGSEPPGLKVVPHAGGMMTGNNRRQITDEWRNYVIPHDKRIAEMTASLLAKPISTACCATPRR